MHDGTEVAPADAYLLSTLDDDLFGDYFEKYILSLTCTLYSHVSFVFELAHGCISYVCWLHEVASFFFLHKGNIERSHRSLCKIALSWTKQIFKLRRLLCSFSWVHMALKDYFFKGM